MIQDLSFPRNDPTTSSVNSHVVSDDFPTAWGTFSKLSTLILELPQGCQATVFDISSAYRITPVLPTQQHVLCVFWRGKVYVDRAVCFGLRSSAGVFGAIADMIVDICEASGFGPIKKWVDDFIVIWLPHQTWTETEFVQLMAALGVPWSMEKTKPLADIQRYLGFNWNLSDKSVAFPVEKLDDLQALLLHWFDTSARFTSQEASRLHGKLVHATTIFPIIRPFLRSIARFALKFQSPRARLRSTDSVRADVKWIADMLHKTPNTLPLTQPTPVDLQWWGDASTSFGIGVTVGPAWEIWEWSPGFHVGPSLEYDIGWAEAVAIELGLQLAVVTHQIGTHSAGQVFLVRSDNEGVVTVLNKGRSWSRQTNTVLKRIYMMLATLGVQLRAVHVRSDENITDPLSRGDIPAFLSQVPQDATRKRHSLPLPHSLSNALRSWSSPQPQSGSI